MAPSTDTNLSTTIAGIRLEHPVMNAAGVCKTFDDVVNLVKSATSAIMVGSITIQPREGNIGETYWSGPGYALNSLGLPNRGAEYYRETLPRMVAYAHGEGKPLFVSVAGFNPEEYADLTELAIRAGVDYEELNLGCPNVWSGSDQKRIACFDPQLVKRIINVVEERVQRIGKNKTKIGVKVSTYSDPYLLECIARVLNAQRLIQAVTSTNTFPSATHYTPEGHPNIRMNGNPHGLAGLSGPPMLPIGLGQVSQLRDALDERIQIIGVGGITRGQDVRHYQTSGAVVTQVATAYLEYGPRIFEKLLGELL